MQLVKCALVSLCLLAPAGLHAERGGDISAGGGGGNVSLASGFTPNQFDVTAFSSQAGVVGQVLKYYVEAGGVRQENRVMIWYQIAGQEADNAIIESKERARDDDSFLQLNFHVPYADLLEMRSGNGYTTIRFRGILANDLYAGMEKSGLKPVGHSIDPQDDDRIVGNIYSDDGVGCTKSGQGTSCHLIFKPHNDAPNR